MSKKNYFILTILFLLLVLNIYVFKEAFTVKAAGSNPVKIDYIVRSIIINKSKVETENASLQNQISASVQDNQELVSVIREGEYKYTNLTRIKYRLVIKVFK